MAGLCLARCDEKPVRLRDERDHERRARKPDRLAGVRLEALARPRLAGEKMIHDSRERTGRGLDGRIYNGAGRFVCVRHRL
jgi:hypothetical protein